MAGAHRDLCRAFQVNRNQDTNGRNRALVLDWVRTRQFRCEQRIGGSLHGPDKLRYSTTAYLAEKTPAAGRHYAPGPEFKHDCSTMPALPIQLGGTAHWVSNIAPYGAWQARLPELL